MMREIPESKKDEIVDEHRKETEHDKDSIIKQRSCKMDSLRSESF